MNKVALGFVLVVLASPLVAHQGGSADTSTIVSTDGVVGLWVKNDYDHEATYKIEVMTKDWTEVPEDQWRSTLRNDRVTLPPEQYEYFSVQTKERGKYYVCTTLEVDVGPISRICIRHWHK